MLSEMNSLVFNGFMGAIGGSTRANRPNRRRRGWALLSCYFVEVLKKNTGGRLLGLGTIKQIYIILQNQVYYTRYGPSSSRPKYISEFSYWYCHALKEYYEIVGESHPLSAFSPTHADLFTEMHFCS